MDLRSRAFAPSDPVGVGASPPELLVGQPANNPVRLGPPSEPAEPTFAPSQPRSGSFGRTAAVAALSFIIGGAVAIGGFVAGQRSGQDVSAVDGAASAPAVLETVGAADPEITSGEANPLDGDPVTSPVALVAEAVGPSVVQVETNNGQGSGVVYDEGLILTNQHVIEGASAVRVRTSEGQVFEVDVVGGDRRNDVAVLRLSDQADPAARDALVAATIGNSDDLRVGELAVAIGSPFALQQTVTSGIISSLNRPVINLTGTYNARIQTDAPINPGNSGGALVNGAGEVVGINSSIRTDGVGASNVGIGFAIPIDTALRVAQRIIEGETLQPGVLGVVGSGSDGDLGVPIAQVTQGSAAELAGLQIGDRLLTIDGAPVTSIDEVIGLVQSHFPGESIELTYLRLGEERRTVATLGDT